MEHALTLATFVFFTALVGLLTWRLTRRDDHESSGGYFLAGRSLTGGYIAGSLLLTNLSTEQLVGLNGAAYADGLCVMAWEVVAAMSLVVLALVFLPRYLKSGIATVPQFLEERYDAGTRQFTTIIFLVAYTAILLPIILYTGATGMTGILDVRQLTGIESTAGNIWLMVWLIGIIGSIYAIFGGLRTVAVSDTLNGFGLLTGGVMIALFALATVNSAGPVAALETLMEQHPEKFNSLGGPHQSVPFSTLFTGVLLLNLFYWTTNQQIIQRTFGAKSLAEGQKGVLIAGVFKMLAPIILVIPGIVAFHQYGQIEVEGQHHAITAVNTEQGTVTYQTSAGAQQQPVENTARYLPVSLKDRAYGRLVQQILPWYLRGFFAAAVIGAILSSFNSALNSSATLFSLGVYRDMLHPNATDAQVIHAGKVFGWIAAIASMTIAPLLMGQDSIFGYLQDMNALYFIPIFAVMVVGLTTTRVPAVAAKAGLTYALLVMAIKYFVPGVGPFVDGLMHNFHFLGLVFASTIALMLMIGAIRPRPTPYVQQSSGAVDLTPWKPAWPVGLALVAIVLGVYIAFADPSIIFGS